MQTSKVKKNNKRKRPDPNLLSDVSLEGNGQALTARTVSAPVTFAGACIGSPDQGRSELQRALEGLGVTPQWIAARLKENAESLRPIAYMGKITDWTPDTANRVKAAEQILRVRGWHSDGQTVGIGVEISLDERRQIQVKAAARLAHWGKPYEDAGDETEDA